MYSKGCQISFCCTVVFYVSLSFVIFGSVFIVKSDELKSSITHTADATVTKVERDMVSKVEHYILYGTFSIVYSNTKYNYKNYTGSFKIYHETSSISKITVYYDVRIDAFSADEPDSPSKLRNLGISFVIIGSILMLCIICIFICILTDRNQNDDVDLVSYKKNIPV
jgi:hypothetical protein